MEPIKVGDTVVWAKPEGNETGDVMLVLEVNGDRTLVEYQNAGMGIKPTGIVRTADLIPK
jgi:hypothetical protein